MQIGMVNGIILAYSRSIFSNSAALATFALLVPNLFVKWKPSSRYNSSKQEAYLRTYVMKTTSHFPSFRPLSPNFSKSIVFCSSLSFPPVIASGAVTRRPYSLTRVYAGLLRSSCRRNFPVAPVAPRISALFPLPLEDAQKKHHNHNEI